MANAAHRDRRWLYCVRCGRGLIQGDLRSLAPCPGCGHDVFRYYPPEFGFTVDSLGAEDRRFLRSLRIEPK